jgi:hypothetical protein
MNEAYAVGIEISLGGNLGKVIAGMIEQFGQLDKAVQRTQGSVNQLASAMRVLARQAQAGATAFDSMASAAGRAASAAERAAKAGGSKWRDNVAGAAPAGGASPRPMLLLAPPGDTPRVAAPGAEPGRSLVPYQATPWGDANRPPIDVPWSHTQDQEAARTEARKREGGDMWLNAMAAGIGGAALAHTFDAAATVDSIQANLLSQHWTSQQVAQARQEAFDLQKKVVPSTVAGNMQIIADAFAIFNNAGEALKAAPGLVKAASSMAPRVRRRHRWHPGRAAHVGTLRRNLQLRQEREARPRSEEDAGLPRPGGKSRLCEQRAPRAGTMVSVCQVGRRFRINVGQLGVLPREHPRPVGDGRATRRNCL